MTTSLKYETHVSQAFGENAYLVWRDGGDRCLVVDPGFQADQLLKRLAELNLTLEAIVNTHGHADHIAGNSAIKEAYPDAPIIIGEQEAEMLINPTANLSQAFGMPITSPPADQTLNDGTTISLLGLDWTIGWIPGHSPGHIVLTATDHDPPVVLVGDVIFQGSIGRTDFPGGSLDSLVNGIRQKLYTLPDDTLLLPGHGPVTTVGQEKRTNPFT